MAAENNDFNINLGDTIYSDSEVGGAPVARTVSEKWGKYKLGLALPALQKLRASAGLYSHWDDHEFINDFSRAEHGGAIYAAGVKAFTDYAPVAKPSANGLYRTFRWGKNLELFFLDERSFRSAKAAQVCGGDLAPTAPQAVRDAFSTLAPGLKNPVSPACLAAINDPSRTMLGARQYAAFTKAIKASTATWKVIVNEVPIQQFYALPYDRWEGYAAERERLLRFLQANVTQRRLPHHRHAREPRQRGAVQDARRCARGNGHLGGRHRSCRHELVREGDRRRPRPEGCGDGDRRALLQAAAAERDGHALRRPRHLQLLGGERYGQAPHRLDEGRQGPAGARGDGRRLRPARPDGPLTTSGRHADYPHGGRP